MELWVHQQIKNAVLIDLQTINQDHEIFSVPCLISYDKGISFLHPLRSYDQSYNNVKHNDNASIYIENIDQKTPSMILLKGNLKILRSREKWNLLKQYWNRIFPFLQSYFELQERYVDPGRDQALLSFTPVQIVAWGELAMEPIKLDLEIV